MGAGLVHYIAKVPILRFVISSLSVYTLYFIDDYKTRMGMTQKPMFLFLDPTDTWPVTHFWMKIMYLLENVLAHLYARDKFPDNTPTMRGQRKGDIINDALKQAQKAIKDLQKEKLFMLVGQADPHGHGGTTGGHLQAMWTVIRGAYICGIWCLC